MVRGLSLLLPGLRQFAVGRRVEGGCAMGVWVLLWAVALTRPGRLLGALSGGWEGWLALLTLGGGLLGIWFWGLREGGGEGTFGGQEGAGGRPFGGYARAGRGFWFRFRENRLALLGLGVILLSYLTALLTPLLAPFDPSFQPAFQGGAGLRLLPPGGAYLLGTDQLSRDVLSRILYGARISLSIGLVAVGISVTIGTVLGSVAGYLGGWVDTLVMRLVDMVMAFPRVVLLIALVALFRPSIHLIVLALALTQWPSSTRIVRGEVLTLKEREFAEAARALGFSRARIIFRHILPNALPPVIVAATLGVGNTIVLEAGLSFLGLGVQPPTPSWGTMVSDGRGYLLDAWWIATFPGLAMVLVVLAFNLVGDGIRDALDPRQGGKGRR